MKNIPTKIREMFSILVDVNLKENDYKQYLEIATEACHLHNAFSSTRAPKEKFSPFLFF